MINTEKSMPATAAALGGLSLLWTPEVSSFIGAFVPIKFPLCKPPQSLYLRVRDPSRNDEEILAENNRRGAKS